MFCGEGTLFECAIQIGCVQALTMRRRVVCGGSVGASIEPSSLDPSLTGVSASPPSLSTTSALPQPAITATTRISLFGVRTKTLSASARGVVNDDCSQHHETALTIRIYPA